MFSLWADHYYSLKLGMKLHYSSIIWFWIIHSFALDFSVLPVLALPSLCYYLFCHCLRKHIYTFFFLLPYLSSLSLILDCDFDSPLFSFLSLFPPALPSVTTRSQWRTTMILTIPATADLEVDLNRFLITLGSF